MSQELATELYEEGRTLSKIAKALGKTLSEVTELLEKKLTGEASEKEQKQHRVLKRMRAMADALTLQYLERLQDTIDSPESTDKQKAAAFEEIDKVMKIAKQTSDRVLLLEGRTTENIGIHTNAMPFNVMFTKTYETPEEAEEDLDTD
jgi:predicted transcriptional regulator